MDLMQLYLVIQQSKMLAAYHQQLTALQSTNTQLLQALWGLSPGRPDSTGTGNFH